MLQKRKNFALCIALRDVIIDNIEFLHNEENKIGMGNTNSGEGLRYVLF